MESDRQWLAEWLRGLKGQLEHIAFLLLIIGGMLFAFSLDYSHTVTVYRAGCSDNKHSILDCPASILTDKTVFKVFPETQLVISKLDVQLPTDKKCTVFDSENWICRDSADSKDGAEMTDGKFYALTDPAYGVSFIYVTEGVEAPAKGQAPFMPIYQQIGWFKYWFYKIENLI